MEQQNETLLLATIATRPVAQGSVCRTTECQPVA
jgi:hypothetical protein